MQQTFTEMREDFLAKLAELPPPMETARTRRAGGVAKKSPEQTWICHIWPIMRRAVTTGVGLPAAEPVELTFSQSKRALPNIGGVIVPWNDDEWFRVSVECERVGIPWVLVQHEGEFIAVTVDQAFRLGLAECQWPETA